MSLLFDALKRAQGNEAKPDASSPGKEATSSEARTKASILPYAAAGLVILAGGVSWFSYQQYQQNQYAPIATQRPAPVIAAIEPASQAAAASSVAQADALASLPATASGADSLTYKDKSWTHPVDTQKPPTKKRKSGRKSLKPGILASTSIDPLKEGYLALSEGRMDQAEQNYLAALAQRPHEKDALLGLAVIAQRKKQTERAAELYRQVLREDLGNAAAAAGLVSLSMQADPVAAESQVRELLDLKPSAPEFHYALGSVLARQLRWGEAQQAFFRAYNLTPDNALYAYNLAVSLDRLHQPAAALPYYEQASKLAKDPTLDQDAIGRRIQELKSGR